jgi:diacylglycerol kinase family enzyme
MATAVFLNPNSGSVSEKTADDLRSAFGEDLAIEAVSDPELYGIIQKRMAARESIVAAGGDGTVATVAACMIGSDQTLGILPLGTLNHFARDLHIPLDLRAAIKVIHEGHPILIDTGCLGDHPFVNNSSLGLYPRLVLYREPLEAKGLPRWAALCSAAFYILTHYQTMSVEFEIEGQKIVRRTPLVFVGNNIYTLKGLRAGSRESLQDGVLTVVIARQQNPWSFLFSTLRTLAGLGRKDTSLEILRLRSLKVRTKRKRVAVSNDGEVTHMQSPLSYTIRPRSLSVFVPASA